MKQFDNKFKDCPYSYFIQMNYILGAQFLYWAGNRFSEFISVTPVLKFDEIMEQFK